MEHMYESASIKVFAEESDVVQLMNKQSGAVVEFYSLSLPLACSILLKLYDEIAEITSEFDYQMGELKATDRDHYIHPQYIIQSLEKEGKRVFKLREDDAVITLELSNEYQYSDDGELEDSDFELFVGDVKVDPRDLLSISNYMLHFYMNG